MAMEFGNHIQETSTVTGTADYILAGAVSGYATFASQISNGATVLYFAWEGGSWEYGIGTFSTGPDTVQRPATPIASSNGGALVSWGASTVVNVLHSADSTVLAPYLTRTGTTGAGTQATGLLARTATDAMAARSIQSGAAGTVTITNGDGIAGDPTIDDSKALRKTGGTDASRTMDDELILGDPATRIDASAGFSAGKHTVRAAASSDDILEVIRNGAADYALNLLVGGTAREVWNAGNDGDGSGLDADLLKGFDFDAASASDFTPNFSSGNTTTQVGHIALPFTVGGDRVYLNFGLARKDGASALAEQTEVDVTLSQAYSTRHVFCIASVTRSNDMRPANNDQASSFCYPKSGSELTTISLGFNSSGGSDNLDAWNEAIAFLSIGY